VVTYLVCSSTAIYYMTIILVCLNSIDFVKLDCIGDGLVVIVD
jgi:hypothetical protein